MISIQLIAVFSLGKNRFGKLIFFTCKFKAIYNLLYLIGYSNSNEFKNLIVKFCVIKELLGILDPTVWYFLLFRFLKNDLLLQNKPSSSLCLRHYRHNIRLYFFGFWKLCRWNRYSGFYMSCCWGQSPKFHCNPCWNCFGMHPVRWYDH